MEVIRIIWLFFQDQILGMKWMNALIGNALTAMGLSLDSIIGGAVQFLSTIPSKSLFCSLY